jgi:4-hydroxythreonine-4-phosphate dehydrogenase
MKKPIAITAGEPAGIGYDILVQAAQKKRQASPWLVFADPDVLRQRAAALNLPLTLELFRNINSVTLAEKTLTVWPAPSTKKVTPGVLDIAHVPAMMRGLSAAAAYCLQGQASALITLPVHKGIINQAGIPFSGHTEFFAELAGVKKVVMMLAAKKCRVVLVTTHLPLSQVATSITIENITETISILVAHLKHFYHVDRPNILVMGLNPHAGESGHLGREEIDIIEPALAALKIKTQANLIGPLAADTLFQKKYLADADAIVAMYHDQGLAPLKAMYFGEIVNITCGLPFIRTSVDHGVALDIAGTGTANIDSFLMAVAVTEEMAALSKEH